MKQIAVRDSFVTYKDLWQKVTILRVVSTTESRFMSQKEGKTKNNSNRREDESIKKGLVE